MRKQLKKWFSTNAIYQAIEGVSASGKKKPGTQVAFKCLQVPKIAYIEDNNGDKVLVQSVIYLDEDDVPDMYNGGTIKINNEILRIVKVFCYRNRKQTNKLLEVYVCGR